MSQQYVATAKKATAVSKSLVCHFTGPDDLNLLIAKGARLEIRDITPEGLQHRLDVPLYGSIATMETYRLSEENTDRLFILTERYQFCVLQYNAAHQVGNLTQHAGSSFYTSKYYCRLDTQSPTKYNGYHAAQEQHFLDSQLAEFLCMRRANAWAVAKISLTQMVKTRGGRKASYEHNR